MIRRVKWLEFAGKGKDLAGMTADTANTPHRGISATSASSTPSSGDCARQRGGICSAAARLHRSLAARRGGPCKAGKRKPGMPGFCACGRPSGKLAFRAASRTHKKSRAPLAHGFLLLLCGEGGIRTPGTVIPYVSLANWWFKPLTHLTGHHSGYGFLNGTANINLFRRTEKFRGSGLHQCAEDNNYFAGTGLAAVAAVSSVMSISDSMTTLGCLMILITKPPPGAMWMVRDWVLSVEVKAWV